MNHSQQARASRKKQILFVGGDVAQTRQIHDVAKHLGDYEQYFSPHWGDRFISLVRELGLIEYTIAGNKRGQNTLDYLHEQGLRVDKYGRRGCYDLVVSCSDILVPRNIRYTKLVVVQEGIFDPEHRSYRLIRLLPFLPRWMAGTAMTGMSGLYDAICVASPGFRAHMIARGADPNRVHITGLIHYDNCRLYEDNEFPHRGYVLACTSDGRETWKADDREAFIARALELAQGRQVIFKLHPNEDYERSEAEIRAQSADALIYYREPGIKAEEMVANCEVLLTEWSTLVFVGLALGKECYSYHDMELLKQLMPIQNGGSSAEKVAEICRRIIESPEPPTPVVMDPKRSLATRIAEAFH
ncbi:hypothetical protein [Haliangium ochraceum]|uniref:Uncharacterized protein n=1 Tax=Haliangium ochraceum (strain DSM 14365 / JCM 11303 / SMP-2) TaxID=502025 RepID=D0LIV1_HALO1|nr:hypothetical protein [Haliangium ochraceum]ACY12980.1 hypothetical protein Hoch_0339 [Haliangium ochraceum DSM 14365]